LITAGLPLLVLASVLASHIRFAEAEQNQPPSSPKIVPVSEVQWTPLNPARGDASPQAGTLWGDRAGSLQTGFLVKFADGFSSPPHIHNVTYRGVVISGEIHNDDPDAEELWMPAGSFWTQPAGEVHITAAQGEENIAYIEIDRGPYLVLSSDQANDNGERPVNVHESNLVWLGSADTTWISTEGPEMAFLWGTPQKGKTNGTMLKLPAGFEGEIHAEDAPFKAVVIKGQPQVQMASESKSLDPGSYFHATEKSVTALSSHSDKPSLLYLRSEGRFKILPPSN
ncbi:MAG: DUF4437 domain-containing protein, partial [Verrucomicrobiota bacterium]